MNLLLNSMVSMVMVLQLGSNDYKIREKSFCTLKKELPLVQLLVSERNPNLEISTRSKSLCNYYFELQASKITEYKNLPWISETPNIQERVAQYYLTRARKELGMRGPPHWEDYSLGTKYFVQDCIRERINPEPFLKEFQQVQRTWIAQNGSRFDPPLIAPK